MEEQIKDKQSSIEINKTSTGKYSWSVKIYFNEEKTNGEEIIKEVTRLNDLLKLRYDKDE